MDQPESIQCWAVGQLNSGIRTKALGKKAAGRRKFLLRRWQLLPKADVLHLCADIPGAHAGASSPVLASSTAGPAFCSGKGPHVQEAAERGAGAQPLQLPSATSAQEVNLASSFPSLGLSL